MGAAMKMLWALWKFSTIRTGISIVKRSKIPPPESRLEMARAFGVVTEKNETAFLAVEEMMKHPLPTEQKRAQIAKNSPHLVRYDDPKRP